MDSRLRGSRGHDPDQKNRCAVRFSWAVFLYGKSRLATINEIKDITKGFVKDIEQLADGGCSACSVKKVYGGDREDDNENDGAAYDQREI